MAALFPTWVLVIQTLAVCTASTSQTEPPFPYFLPPPNALPPFLPLAHAGSASLGAGNLSTSTALEPGDFLLSGELGNPFSLSAETGGNLYRSASTNCLPEEPPISPPATYKT